MSQASIFITHCILWNTLSGPHKTRPRAACSPRDAGWRPLPYRKLTRPRSNSFPLGERQRLCLPSSSETHSWYLFLEQEWVKVSISHFDCIVNRPSPPVTLRIEKTKTCQNKEKKLVSMYIHWTCIGLEKSIPGECLGGGWHVWQVLERGGMAWETELLVSWPHLLHPN